MEKYIRQQRLTNKVSFKAEAQQRVVKPAGEICGSGRWARLTPPIVDEVLFTCAIRRNR